MCLRTTTSSVVPPIALGRGRSYRRRFTALDGGGRRPLSPTPGREEHPSIHSNRHPHPPQHPTEKEPAACNVSSDISAPLPATASAGVSPTAAIAIYGAHRKAPQLAYLTPRGDVGLHTRRFRRVAPRSSLAASPPRLHFVMYLRLRCWVILGDGLGEDRR